MRNFILISGMILALATSAPAGYPQSMVVVPAGIFIMGDGDAYCGEDEREVTLTRDFYLGQHEVTNQEYLEAVQWAYDHEHVTVTTAAVWDNMDGSTVELLELDNEYSEIQFDGAGAFYLRESPSPWTQNAYPDGYDPTNHPVEMVTWYGSVRYCDWLSLQAGLLRAYEHTGDWSCNSGDPYGAQGYRLPTDAEWEYAAHFDDERSYPWGDERPNCSRVNFWPNWPYDFCVGWTTPVGSYPHAPEELGLSDMAGNVFEWCNDWQVCDLGTAPVTNPTGPSSGTDRVLRGGHFGSFDYVLRCAARFCASPGDRGFTVGFRAARTFNPQAIGNSETDRSQLLLAPGNPNPFTAQTHISYEIPTTLGAAPVLLTVHDAASRRVCTLTSGVQAPGPHTVSWNGSNDAGQPFPAGVYFCRLSAGGQTVTHRLLLVR